MTQLRRPQDIQDIEEESQEPEDDQQLSPYEGNTDRMISTGSTGLDLAISGTRIHGGGIPGGILLEIFGPSGTGKTAILSEIIASVQERGGDAGLLDPEGRIDKRYTEIYGVNMAKTNYEMPDTVSEAFKYIWDFKPQPSQANAINCIGLDSIAALSTKLELSDKEDKMGMKRAKDLSQGTRKICRIIKKNNWIVPCTNQIRSGPGGETTPGGEAVKFHASIRLRIGIPAQGKTLIREIKFKATPDQEKVSEQSKAYGIKSLVTVKKSSVDDPLRTADIYIVFGYGLDDIRGNLQYCKDVIQATRYDCSTKLYQSMEKAIDYIEAHDLEEWLKEKTIDLWERVQKSLERPRKQKVRK